jgi:RND family efflux transporter MFP subunit
VARSRWLAVGLPPADFDALLRDTASPAGRALAVRSPVAGTVVHADLAVGKVVEPLDHLFEVVDLSSVWVRVDVLERDLARVAVGRPVEVRLTAHPGEVFRAAVVVQGMTLDPKTHLAAVWAELPNPPGAEPRLLPGMSGEARVLLPASPAPSVPAAAVVREGAERYVLVEEASAGGGSEYRRRAVAPGREAGGRTEVRSGGLVPGDRVLTQGGHELAAFFIPGVLRLTPEAERTIGLAVEPVSLRAVDEVVETDGLVDLPPDRRGAASSPLAGSVARLLADRGQAVAAGQVLAEVVSPAFQSLQADYLRAHLDGQVLEDTLRRLTAAGEGAVPRRRLLEQEAAVTASRQQRDALRARLRLAGLDDARLDALAATGTLAEAVPVRAPVGGVVAGFDRTLGQAVRAEEPILTVHDLSRPVVRGAVGERDLARVRVGQRVRVRLTADPGFLADGTVTRSGRAVAADSRSLAVWVELDRPPAAPLLHNQLARLAVVVAPGEPVPAVPLAAVVAEGTEAFVFVRRPDGVFDRRPVRLGRADDRHVEVRVGLRPGDPVAVRGAAELNTAHAGIR